ncbi:MAG: hypothetical protein WCP28_22005, partial [Actinomycetes bacterium]
MVCPQQVYAQVTGSELPPEQGFRGQQDSWVLANNEVDMAVDGRDGVASRDGDEKLGSDVVATQDRWVVIGISLDRGH